MVPRDVYLGPFDMGALYASEQALRRTRAPFAESTDLFRLLCTMLIQAGADRFCIPGGEPSAFTTSEYLRSRITNSFHISADRSWAQIRDLFTQFLPATSEKDGPELGEARRLQSLLCDLARAAESGTSVAVVARLPNLESAAKVLPPDLIFPARVLVRGLLTEVSAVPVPMSHLAKRDVAVLAELMQSDVYGTYRSAHQALEQANVGLPEGLARVSSSALVVRRAGGKMINIIDRVISFLPATTKLIEELAGKPAGIVAEALAKPFETWLRSRSRLVIYRFDIILDELMKAWQSNDRTTKGT